MLYFNFAIHSFQCSCAKEIKQFVRSIMSLITFDASIISSPGANGCDIGLGILNMCIPLMFSAFFVVWCWCVRQYYRQIKYQRNLINRIVAVAAYVWITTMFALTMEHIMTAFDCTTNEALNRTTLDIDPTIVRKPKHMEIQYWAVGGFLAYIGFGLKGYNLFKQHQHCVKCHFGLIRTIVNGL